MSSQSIAIIGGCGHVGLPLGLKLAEAGFHVNLIDTDLTRVQTVQSGVMPFLERGADELLQAALNAQRLTCQTDLTNLSKAQTVVITIGTPLDEFLNPRVMSFDKSMAEILDHCVDGQLLILRSTVYPRMTDRLIDAIEQRGLKIDLANCPERIAQGYAIEELEKLPQLIGARTDQAYERARDLFSAIGNATHPECLRLTPIESELAKLFANSYRYINFAISNQFYMMADQFNADFFRIHRAVTHNYPRLQGFAGAGFVGGPCLLKDTMQLAAFHHYQFGLGHAAMAVNEDLPMILVNHAKRTYDLSQMTAAILGMTYKGDNDDTRDSLAFKLRKILHIECQSVLCTDPYLDSIDPDAKDPQFVSLETVLNSADIVFLGACHEQYRTLKLTQPLIDCFNFIGSD